MKLKRRHDDSVLQVCVKSRISDYDGGNMLRKAFEQIVENKNRTDNDRGLDFNAT